ncbi:type VI secretion system-associated FHA domain protein TagH [Pseudorhodoferax sp.]|uniref:type VI secretion system-associated FHA domain protein TagH n=1 Tax=Pseudorhodoferax sp. TaxID=1993553 RepID=UPI002DD6A152|nr:type VI secretion system-associated FHA domain protein TagH [Pseudorhodoferax sp.]
MEQIELRVEQRAGVAVEGGPRAAFGVAGGTIGRGSQNKLVLADAEAGVARVHAMVRLESHGAHIANLCERRSMYVDQRELRSGEEVPLLPGAVIGIGPYLLRAWAADSVATAPSPLVAAAPPRPAVEPPAVVSAAPTEAIGATIRTTPNPWSDIPQQFGDATQSRYLLAGGGDALKDLLPAATTSGKAAGGIDQDNPFAMLGRVESGRVDPTPVARTATPAIPDDFDPLDPFARDPVRQVRAADPWAGGLPAVGLTDVAPQRHDALLHNLAPAAAHEALDRAAHRGLPGSLDPQVELDPLRLFDSAAELPVAGDATVALPRGPELGQLFALPVAVEAPPMSTLTPTPAPTSAPAAAPSAPPMPPAPSRPAAAAPPQPAQSPAAITPEQLRQLMAAFLDGAGLPPQRTEPALTPEFMRAFGQALRVAAQGTIDLLAARAEVKKELRAGVTIIASGANNPLKFLPNADGVLLQMTGQHFPGFMQPVSAMEEAYRDLRVHQVALMAGIRAAYSEALTRFDPTVIEQRAAAGFLARVSSIGRKAALWDSYSQGYAALRRHAEDDLTAFSGRTFVQAYEAAAQAAGGNSP